MLVECVIACSVYVFPCLKVFLTLANFASIVDFSSHVYGTGSPSGLNLFGYTGVEVTGAMFRWNAFGSIKLYISGDITAPAHPLTAACGHGIFLSAIAK